MHPPPRSRALPLLSTRPAWALAIALLATCTACARGRPRDDGDATRASLDAGASTFDMPAASGDEPTVSEAPVDDDDDDGDDRFADGAANPSRDGGGRDGASREAGPAGACNRKLAPGDLAIVELAISTAKGTGDHGEWVEVRSTADCALDLKGLHGDCPVGSKVHSFDLLDSTWLPAHGSFVVADSTSAAINHALPGLVFAWDGEPGDTLRNLGATVSLNVGGILIEAATYPEFDLTSGVAMAFPADCPLAQRGVWDAWMPANASYYPGFYGTPNAANDDVACPYDFGDAGTDDDGAGGGDG